MRKDEQNILHIKRCPTCPFRTHLVYPLSLFVVCKLILPFVVGSIYKNITRSIICRNLLIWKSYIYSFRAHLAGSNECENTQELAAFTFNQLLIVATLCITSFQGMGLLHVSVFKMYCNSTFKGSFSSLRIFQ